MLRRVLVADDEPHHLRLVEVALSRIGCEVTCARNGLEALNCVADKDLDLVILDVVMPGIDGLTLLKRIRANPATEDLLVIILSAKQGDADIYNGYHAGADMYLTKPFNVDELTTFVRR